MTNLIRADLFRLRRSTGVLIVLGIAVVAAASYVYLAHLIGTGTLDVSTAGSASVVSDVLIVYLLGSLLAGLLVCHDFETKTVHDALLSSSRAAVVSAKAVVFVGLVAMLVAPYGIAALVGFVSGQEFATFLPTPFLVVAANEPGLPVDASSVGTVLGVTTGTALVYAARLSVCLPLAFVIKRPVAVMALGFGWGFVADLLAGLVDDVPVLADLVALTPYAARYAPTLTSDAGDLLRASVVAVAFLVLMTFVAYLLFRRADVK